MHFDMFLRGETTQGGGDNVSDPFSFTSPVLLRARSYDSGSKEWSALNEAFFSIDSVPAGSGNLIISEINYHPFKPTRSEEIEVSTDRDDFEFIEFFNTGVSAIDLTGIRFESGVNFTFPDNTILAAGKYLLLVRDRQAFETRYGVSEVQIYEYTGRLSNDGEKLRVIDDSSDSIIDFTYNDQIPWPKVADGDGSSLILSGEALNDPSSWVASRNQGGSPGEAEAETITYDEWALQNAVQGGPGDDDDGDNVSNYLEYYFGSRPDLATDAPFADAKIQIIEGANYLTLSFPRNLLAGGSFEVQHSSDLHTWMTDSAMFEVISTLNNGNGTAKVTVRYLRPVDDGAKKVFLRLSVN